MSAQPEISVVVPALNEAPTLARLCDEIRRVLEPVCSYEIVIVDDGSTDGTLAELERLHERDPRIRFVSLSRNFGHQAALRAGIEHARGRCVATMDADLQHPPDLLPMMLDRWRAGDRIVTTLRAEDPHLPLGKRLTSRAFYGLINLLGDVRIEPGSADFFLIDRSVVEVIRRLPDREVFFRGLLPWLGFARSTIRYEPRARAEGSSRYSLRRMLRLGVSGVIAHSLHPLRIATILALMLASMAIVYMAYSIVVHFVSDRVVPGWTSVIVVVTLIGALQLLVLGIIGEYVGRSLRQVQGRPPYVVARSERDRAHTDAPAPADERTPIPTIPTRRTPHAGSPDPRV